MRKLNLEEVEEVGQGRTGGIVAPGSGLNPGSQAPDLQSGSLFHSSVYAIALKSAVTFLPLVSQCLWNL